MFVVLLSFINALLYDPFYNGVYNNYPYYNPITNSVDPFYSNPLAPSIFDSPLDRENAYDVLKHGGYPWSGSHDPFFF